MLPVLLFVGGSRYTSVRAVAALNLSYIITISNPSEPEQGLFVIRATGNSARIINPTGFRPKSFDAGAGAGEGN